MSPGRRPAHRDPRLRRLRRPDRRATSTCSGSSGRTRRSSAASRDLRDAPGAPCALRDARKPDRRGPRRDRRPGGTRWRAPRAGAEPPVGAGRAPGQREGALGQITPQSRSWRATSPASRTRSRPSCRRRPVPAAAGGPGRRAELERADLARQRPGRLRLRLRASAARVPPGHRHRRARAAPRSGPPRRAPSSSPSPRRAAAATATSPASTTAAGSPPATRTRSPSRSPPASTSARAR